MTSAINQTNGTDPLNKPILKEGITGEVVKQLQQLLRNYHTYSGAIDGVFGSETAGGVILFQHRVFLSEDGIVGHQTWQALYKGGPVNLPILQRGSQGKLVKALQQRLYIVGEYTGIFDSNFDCATEVAVKAFQRRHKLAVDGIVGDRTWFALSNLNKFSC